MRKDVKLFNDYLSANYNLLQMEISKIYSLDMDMFHDSIIDLYIDLSTGLKYKDLSIKEYLLNRYRKYRNKEITKSYTEITKEDNTLEFIDNKTETKIQYSNITGTLKEKARQILSRNDFLILDMYYFRVKPKRLISLFVGIETKEIDKRLEYIKNKLKKNISYENYRA